MVVENTIFLVLSCGGTFDEYNLKSSSPSGTLRLTKIGSVLSSKVTVISLVLSVSFPSSSVAFKV